MYIFLCNYIGCHHSLHIEREVSFPVPIQLSGLATKRPNSNVSTVNGTNQKREGSKSMEQCLCSNNCISICWYHIAQVLTSQFKPNQIRYFRYYQRSGCP